MLKKQFLKSKPVCKVTFALPREAAAEASEILLLGDFNDWNWEKGIVMKLVKDEYRATVELEAERSYEFRYLVDGKSWLNDWEADDYVDSPYLNVDNSVVVIGPAPKPKAPAPKPKAAAPKKTAPAAKKPVAKPKKAAAPKAKTVAKAPKADDLRKIEGIGPKIQVLLNAKGIHTFADLSKAKATLVKSILDEAGSRYRMHDPKTWSKQAGLAAKGEWDKLTKLQDQLKGGK